MLVVETAFPVVGLIDVSALDVGEGRARMQSALRGWRRISAVPPVFYRRRFLAFVSRLLDT